MEISANVHPHCKKELRKEIREAAKTIEFKKSKIKRGNVTMKRSEVIKDDYLIISEEKRIGSNRAIKYLGH